MTTRAEGEFTVSSWQEDTTDELGGAAKLTRARIGYRMTGGLDGDAVSESAMYYREDGTAEFLGIQYFTGEIGGRSGACAMLSEGGYDGGEARATWRVVSGSGTGGLAGLRGSGSSVAAAGPGGTYTLDYEFD